MSDLKSYCESSVLTANLIEKICIHSRLTVIRVGFLEFRFFFVGDGGGQGVKLNGIIVRFSWRCFVSLVNFSYWCKFHINIIIGCGVITISFCKGLTRNPEIGNTPVWILQNIWSLGQVRDTKFGANFSNKMLLNTAKCQGYSFYRFWVIKGKPIGVGKIAPQTPPLTHLPRLGLTKKGKHFCIFYSNIIFSFFLKNSINTSKTKLIFTNQKS